MPTKRSARGGPASAKPGSLRPSASVATHESLKVSHAGEALSAPRDRPSPFAQKTKAASASLIVYLTLESDARARGLIQGKGK